MSFSDDNLKWLKEYLQRPPKNQLERISRKNPTRLREDFFEALLARLEAAEEYIATSETGYGSLDQAYETWCKQAGK